MHLAKTFAPGFPYAFSTQLAARSWFALHAWLSFQLCVYAWQSLSGLPTRLNFVPLWVKRVALERNSPPPRRSFSSGELLL
jgi:hypothetical protein